MAARRFRRLDAAVLLAIIAILACLAIVAVAKSREHAQCEMCMANLQQMGWAMHVIADTQQGTLPSEQPVGSVSIFLSILPFLETSIAIDFMMAGGKCDPSKAQDVSYYLCPSRRQPRTGPAIYTETDSAKGDYAYGSDTSADRNGEQVQGDAVLSVANGLTLEDIAKANGTSNTLLLAHKGMKTTCYAITGPNDYGWATWTNPALRKSSDHIRCPGALVQDGNRDDIAYEQKIGSPHEAGTPAVFADGHTGRIPYSYGGMTDLWSWNSYPVISPPPP